MDRNPWRRHWNYCKNNRRPFLTFKANYAGNQTVFTAEQLVACTLSKFKETTEAFLEAPVSTCVVSCPGWWSHKQRKALLNSCTIADLVPLRVVNDLSAVAFNYGFYRPGAFDEKPAKVMFVSMGHYGFECNIVEMSKPCCTVKAVASDLTLGGYLIDEILADHFATRFNVRFLTSRLTDYFSKRMDVTLKKISELCSS